MGERRYCRSCGDAMPCLDCPPPQEGVDLPYLNGAPAPLADPLDLIRIERAKQRDRWGDPHDDGHINGELAIAAACYAADQTHALVIDSKIPETTDAWPFEASYDNRESYSREKMLVVAAAFLVAEIERLRRRSA